MVAVATITFGADRDMTIPEVDMYMTIMGIITPRMVDTVITTMVAHTIVTTIIRTHSPFLTLFLTYPAF
jgi:hypothetical protein